MGKSRAEIQKAYRERQKAKGSTFLEKERVRQKSYYKPAATLSKKKREERNYSNKLRNRLSRLRRQNQHNEEVTDETSGYESNRTELGSPDDPHHELLIIRFPARSSKAKGLSKTRERRIAKANKKLRVLTDENVQLKKKLKVSNRHINRLNSRIGNLKANNASTPEKKTESLLHTLNLTPERKSHVRRNILATQVVMSEIKKSKTYISRKKSQSLSCIVSGKIAKRYRQVSKIQKLTGLSKWSLYKTTDKTLMTVVRPEKRQRLDKDIELLIIDFYFITEMITVEHSLEKQIPKPLRQEERNRHKS